MMKEDGEGWVRTVRALNWAHRWRCAASRLASSISPVVPWRERVEVIYEN